jgi:hypothetical protein
MAYKAKILIFDDPAVLESWQRPKFCFTQLNSTCNRTCCKTKGKKKEPAAHAIPPWSPTGVLSMRLRLIRGAWGDRTHAKKERELAQTCENFREKRAVSLRVPFFGGRIRLF